MSKFGNAMPFKPGNNHQPQFDPTQATAKLCECGSSNFAKVYKLGLVSNLAPGNRTGRDIMLEVPVYACVNCGKELGAGKAETKQEEGKTDGDTEGK